MEIITLNKIRCKKCGDIIISLSTHDNKMCSCGNCSVDGGHEYLQRNYITNTPEEAFEELSEYQNSPMKKSTDYSKYWLTQSQIEALRQDSKEASLYYAEKFSKILEEKLGYKINR